MYENERFYGSFCERFLLGSKDVLGIYMKFFWDFEIFSRFKDFLGFKDSKRFWDFVLSDKEVSGA